IAALPELPDLMSVAGSQGISLHVFLQSWNQGERRWGREGMQTLWNSCAAAVVLGGSKETYLLDMVAQLGGQHLVNQLSETRSKGDGSSTVSSQLQQTFRSEHVREIP